MVQPIAPLLASPLLGAALYRIAHAPLGRLAVGYRIVPRWLYKSHAQLGPRSLGASWYVDRLIAGGIVGEELPITIVRDLAPKPLIIQAIEADQRQVLGVNLDVWG